MKRKKKKETEADRWKSNLMYLCIHEFAISIEKYNLLLTFLF